MERVVYFFFFLTVFRAPLAFLVAEAFLVFVAKVALVAFFFRGIFEFLSIMLRVSKMRRLSSVYYYFIPISVYSDFAIV